MGADACPRMQTVQVWRHAFARTSTHTDAKFGAQQQQPVHSHVGKHGPHIDLHSSTPV